MFDVIARLFSWKSCNFEGVLWECVFVLFVLQLCAVLEAWYWHLSFMIYSCSNRRMSLFWLNWFNKTHKALFFDSVDCDRLRGESIDFFLRCLTLESRIVLPSFLRDTRRLLGHPTVRWFELVRWCEMRLFFGDTGEQVEDPMHELKHFRDARWGCSCWPVGLSNGKKPETVVDFFVASWIIQKIATFFKSSIATLQKVDLEMTYRIYFLRVELRFFGLPMWWVAYGNHGLPS